MSNNVKCKDLNDGNEILPPGNAIDSDVHKMRWALTAITKEIQRFHHTEKTECDKLDDFELLNKILKYKSRIQMKKKQLKRLNKNVKIYFILVKLLASSKKRDAWNLTKGFLVEKRKRADLIRSYIIKCDLIQNLSKENEQKNIYICNERARCQLLEQKNSFLQNKINILECNIDALKEEIESLNYRLLKRDREVIFYKNKLYNKINQTEVSVDKNLRNITKNKSSNFQHKNLSTHLAQVNSLLNDQERVINNLRNISDIFINKDT